MQFDIYFGSLNCTEAFFSPVTFLILERAGALGISIDTRRGALVLLLLEGMTLLLLYELLRPSLLNVPLILLLFLAVVGYKK